MIVYLETDRQSNILKNISQLPAGWFKADDVIFTKLQWKWQTVDREAQANKQLLISEKLNIQQSKFLHVN